MANNVYDDYWLRRVKNLILNHPRYYLREFMNFNAKLSYRSLFNYFGYIIAFNEYISKNIKDITIDDYANYIASLRETSPSNQTVAHAALKKYSHYLFATQKTASDYMMLIERPNATERQSTIDKRAKGFLNKEEINHVLQNVKTGSNAYIYQSNAEQWRERDVFLIELFLSTGLRLSGVWKLNIEDINFEQKLLITTEKRGKVRTYPLSDELIESCKKWLRVRSTLVATRERALFISKNKVRLPASRMREIVLANAKDIEGKHITPHKLRATYGTQIYEATNDIYLTQQCMGHNSPKTTELYIRGQENKNMAKASEIMKNLIF